VIIFCEFLSHLVQHHTMGMRGPQESLPCLALVKHKSPALPYLRPLITSPHTKYLCKPHVRPNNNVSGNVEPKNSTHRSFARTPSRSISMKVNWFVCSARVKSVRIHLPGIPTNWGTAYCSHHLFLFAADKRNSKQSHCSCSLTDKKITQSFGEKRVSWTTALPSREQ